MDALGQLLGRLHQLVVHFPIALLMVGAIVEVWNAMRRRPGPSPTALVCVGFGAAGAVAAAGMGWLNAAFEQGGNQSWVLFWHRWIGVGTAVVSAAVLLAAWAATRRPRAMRVYRSGLLVAALLVSVGGHFGGMLTYGDDYITSAVVALWQGPEATRPAPQPGPDPVPQPSPRAANGAGENGGVLTIDFDAQVRPILEASFISCHGAKKKKGGLRLDNAEDAGRGGKDGGAIGPGGSDASVLVRRLVTADEL